MEHHPRHASEAHCTFCDLIRGAAEVSVCHEDSDSIAFMDIQPVNNGHVLVVPRQHYESLLDVPEEIGLHLFRVTMRLANAVRHVTGCDDLNIVVNSGAAAGQDEPHYHVHIIPRREGDGFDIPLPFDGSQMPDRTVLDAYAAQIISALRDPMRDSSTHATHATAHGALAVARATVREERPVRVPVFDESRVADTSADVRNDSPSRRKSRPGLDSTVSGHWQAGEGAHGEIVYDDGPENA
jgi:histidine triad (HIT) family protein